MPTNAPIATFTGLSSGLDTSGIIAKLIEVSRKPIALLQRSEAQTQAKLSSFQDFNSRLAALQSAASSLTQAPTFRAASGSSSNTAVATVTASPTALLGDHSLSVTQLAQGTKIVTKALASGNVALGEAGAFTLNGKTVTIGSSDTLADIAVKINAAGANATATVVNVGPNDFRLTLSGTQTGAANALSASDNGSGTVLADLGLVTGAKAIRQTVTTGDGKTGAGSLALGSGTQTVAVALGAPAGSGAAGTIQINGVGVALDLNTDSLDAIANKINGAGIAGVSAQVVTLADANGNTTTGGRQQLQIVGGAGNAPTFTDSSNVLGTLGVLQGGFGSPIASAQDAKFSIDGLNLTRASNVVGDVLPGATIKLLSGTGATPGAATLSIAQNTDAVVKSVNDFVAAYNAAQDFITAQNQFTPPATGADGRATETAPLFGDSTLDSIQSQLSRTLNAVAGSTTLQDIGITVDDKNHLTVDAGALTGALSADPAKVSNLFGLSATTDNAEVRFLSASAKTQATLGAGYAVNVTQAATQARGTAGAAQTGASATAETLTFGGALFAGGASITLTQGNTLQDTVNQINRDATLNGKLYAAIDSAGKLTLAAQQYGAGSGFTVTSNQTASGTTSGLGASTIVTDGLDVAGTINGEPATGKGRSLTGAAGNAKTEGLALLVTAATPGAYGHVTITHGVADGLGSVITSLLDPGTGAIVGAENSLNSQIADSEAQIHKIQDRVSDYSDYLRQIFSAMEQRVSELQAQGNAFAAQLGKR